jgi:outer membrane cobalamin receptor
MRATLATLSFAATLLIAPVGCASAPATHQVGSEPASRSGDFLITGDQIDAEHVGNAWDLLRRMVPRYTYVEDRAGRAVGIVGHRGRSSISVSNSESPLVLVDGARLSSLELLQEMPTDAIDRIEVRGSGRGTSREGTNAGAGVIYIHTRSGS